MLKKVSDLTGTALDYAVALAGGEDYSLKITYNGSGLEYPATEYSTNWEQGGPIIERSGINLMLRYGSLPPNHVQDVWDAVIKPEFYTSGRPNSGVRKEVIVSGPTPLIAAMRCYVASKFGDMVEIPDEIGAKK